MIVRTATVALVLLTAALLQTALFPYLTLAGFRPDLLLLATTAFALRDGVMTGVRVGFAAGLLSDLLVDQSALGLTALIFVGVGYAVGTARPFLAHGSVTAPVLLAFMSGLLGTAGFGVFSRLLGDERYTFQLVAQASLFVALYNTLLSPVMVGVVDRIAGREPVEGAAVT